MIYLGFFSPNIYFKKFYVQCLDFIWCIFLRRCRKYCITGIFCGWKYFAVGSESVNGNILYCAFPISVCCIIPRCAYLYIVIVTYFSYPQNSTKNGEPQKVLVIQSRSYVVYFTYDMPLSHWFKSTFSNHNNLRGGGHILQNKTKLLYIYFITLIVSDLNYIFTF